VREHYSAVTLPCLVRNVCSFRIDGFTATAGSELDNVQKWLPPSSALNGSNPLEAAAELAYIMDHSRKRQLFPLP
jgi:hypothetical protein